MVGLNEYQENASRFDRVEGCPRLMYAALGLNEEAGEVAGKVKKVYRDECGVFNAESRQHIALELGDVLWYVAMVASKIGYSLSDVAEMNISKLESRLRRGVIGGSGDNR